ncbi:hypothetical protein CRG98_021227 [Punica granatum]|uniref:Uncharacterized protein n=1 Tax=Punica granatum TaxID=22663 RepID=A0A2I0JQ57_PUNGR|nr:hypothetical protein CRG98_021227 [Punica granatum]
MQRPWPTTCLTIPQDLPIFIRYMAKGMRSSTRVMCRHISTASSFNDVGRHSVQCIKSYFHADFIMGVNVEDVVYSQVLSFTKFALMRNLVQLSGPIFRESLDAFIALGVILIRLGVKPTSLGRKDFVMRIVGTMMGLKYMSSEVGFVKRELMHKISEAYMFRLDQSHERRQDKSSKLWRAHLRVFWAKRRLIRIGP